jgi:ABC-type uncharacterized transport system permease subunit
MLMYRTRFGYEVRVIGENPEAARYAGISFLNTSVVIMAVSAAVWPAWPAPVKWPASTTT